MDTSDTPPQPTRPPAAPASRPPEVPPQPAEPPREPPHAPGPRPDGRGVRAASGPALLAVLAVAVAVVLVLVLTGNGSRHHDDSAPAHHQPSPAGGPSGPGTSDFHAPGTGLILLDGASGRIQVTADPNAHTLTGSYHPADGNGATLHGRSVHDPATGRDALSLGCADGSGITVPCAGDLALTVPEHTGLRLRQTSGRTVLIGLGGDVTVDASSVQLTTSGLRSGNAHFTVTSGSADLSFAGAPRDLDLHETSASVTAHLPHSSDGYAVTTVATSASTQLAVPRNPASTHRLALAITSGSLTVAADG
ncbi:hypothetical protein SAMN05216223_10848 [Actinacidiphila yanglinensis]|uniref:Adhesin domain-containing protein n=1 Tax=Actinacidiphila yanglinensis TaxID=310779 RepID=A0A1H6C4Q6_9ACTN|nr:hypothetical protein [Actinacidiphila yanglinensis]SEG67980.1 hypothetical protein SAMN05216223_10848 [Actinacidiphila yanglinensis]